MRDNMYAINITTEAMVKLLKVGIAKGMIDEGKKSKKDSVDTVTLLDNSEPVAAIMDNHNGILTIQMKTSIHDYSKVSEGQNVHIRGNIIVSNSIKE